MLLSCASTDTTPPTCTLSASSSGVTFASKSSDTVSYGMSTSSTATYNSTTSLALSAGTKYGFVKDAAGNTGSCSLTISTTTINCDSSNYSTRTTTACTSAGYLGYASNSCSTTTYYWANVYHCDEVEEMDAVYSWQWVHYADFYVSYAYCFDSAYNTTGTCSESTAGKYQYKGCSSTSTEYSGTISCYYKSS